MENRINAAAGGRTPQLLPMEGKDSRGNLYQVDNISFLKNGKRFFPVMGEFHYSRYEPEDWEEEILKMKAGGIAIVATYVFWIHHEEIKGEWDFEGCRDLRRFLDTCGRLGMQVWLRIGPWAHGECRNGGFPDWLVEECGNALRSDDPVYISHVRRFYHEIGVRVKGTMVKDAGPVIGIQLENEYGHCGGGPSSQEECKAHMLHLKQMALEEGMEVPYYTSTGWGGGIVVDRETLPVLGGYVDAPWAWHVQPMPASANFVFSPYKQDENIGSDLKRMESRDFTFDTGINPYLTAELGGGLQVTSHRRTFPTASDIEAQTLCMLGSGANLLGYYMYHGGINPEGKKTTLQESRATGYSNDLPVKSYDFQTCIRESGRINESFGRLRRLHLMLEDYGEKMAASGACFAQTAPDSPEDMHTLRTTVRVDPAGGMGFLFINNHQRNRVMEAHPEASVEVLLPDGELVLDHLHIPSGMCGVIPFRMQVGTARLRKTNACLLCRLGDRVFFYTGGFPVEDVYYDWEDAAGDVVTLTAEEAARAWRFGDTLYITEHEDSCLIEKDGKIRLLTVHDEEKILYWHEKGEAARLEVTARKVSAGVRLLPVSAEDEKEGWREYPVEIDCPDVDKVHQLYLQADYLGDRAEVYVDGKLADDWFTTGEKWYIALKRFGYPKELVLRIYSSDAPIPNPYENQVYYDLPVEKGCALLGAAAIPEYSCPVE